MQLEQVCPTEAERDQARRTLAKLLARRLFAEWLQEQVEAGRIAGSSSEPPIQPTTGAAT